MSRSNKDGIGRYYLFIFIAIIGWGLSVPFIEFGLQNIEALSFLSYRFVLATAILTPYAILKKREQVVELASNRWLWIIALSESIGLIAQYLGQQEGIPGGLSALLSLCFLLIVPFLSPFVLNERLQIFHLVAILLGFTGIIFISTEGDFSILTSGSYSILGILLLLSAAFGYALYIVSTSRLTTIEKPDVDIFSLFYLVLLGVAITSTLAAGIFGEYKAISASVWPWLILLTIFSTLIAFFAYFEALKGISANTASVLLLLQVVVPFTVDFLVLGRSYGVWIQGGIALILFAMIIVVGVPFYRARQAIT